MYENCDSGYYNLFMKQFVQTLAQLSAVLVSSTLAVPAYSYYMKGGLFKSKYTNDNNNEKEDLEEDEDEEEDLEEDVEENEEDNDGDEEDNKENTE
jgi:hypothetical protein